MTYKRFQPHLIQLSVVDSTNNYAAKLLKGTNVTNGTTILTKSQYSGKGQRGNKWQSESGKNLIQSTIVLLNLRPDRVFFLNIAASLAVQKTLADLGIEAMVKWPNDVYVGRRKIAGILVENQLQGKMIKSAIVGIGLNVNQTEFPETVNATSVAIEKGGTLEIEDIFNQLYGYLDFYMDWLMQGNYPLLEKRYLSVLLAYEKKQWFEDESDLFEGIIKGVSPTGHLIVRKAGRNAHYDLKEIRFRFDVD